MAHGAFMLTGNDDSLSDLPQGKENYPENKINSRNHSKSHLRNQSKLEDELNGYFICQRFG